MRKTSALIDDPKVTRVITPILSCGVMQNRSDDCPPHSALHQRGLQLICPGRTRGLGGAGTFAHMMNNLDRNLSHHVNASAEICRPREAASSKASLICSPTWDQIYALLICISNFDSNLKKKAGVLTHAAWINTQFILSK